jgi:adenylate cyclase
MAPPAQERKLAAILSADVVGYSRLMAEDESETVRRLGAYRTEITNLVGEHRGRLVDFTGDNFLAEFPTALDAVECAVEVQRVLAARNAGQLEERRLEFRIGVHMGDVTIEGDRLYGDGVNIAARLEGLADPGGICISATIHEQVERKIEFGFEDLGPKEVKNIAKPVRVYRVRLDSAATRRKTPAVAHRRAVGASLVLGCVVVGGLVVWLWPPPPPPTSFGNAPAIAVLPFDNLSGDPELEPLADGIAEDLITRLSETARFPVISRNSSFQYKGATIDVKRASRELGARYVVEGSVRSSRDGIRVAAQLIDGTTGSHLWAEAFDREGLDLQTQDEVVLAIAEHVLLETWGEEQRRVMQVNSTELTAYELVQKGTWHAARVTKEHNQTARAFFEEAVELDPRYVVAIFELGFAHAQSLQNQWTDDPEASISALDQLVKRCVALDFRHSLCHWLRALFLSFTGEREPMLASFSQALEGNKSRQLLRVIISCHVAEAGKPEEALELLEATQRESPRSWTSWLTPYCVAQAHFAAGRYEEAAASARRAIRLYPYPLSYEVLAASLGQLGEGDEAGRALQSYLALTPDFSEAGFRRAFSTADEDFIRRSLDGLRKAGLPEG